MSRTLAGWSSALVLSAILVGCDETVLAERPVESIIMQPESIALAIGQEVLIQATTVPVTPVITFTVRDTTIAGINDAGIVTARNFGKTYVVAEARGVRDSSVIAVPEPYIMLSVDSITVRVGEQGSVLHQHNYGTTPVVTSADTMIARVAYDFSVRNLGRWLITGVSAGTTMLVASTSNGPLTVRDTTFVTVAP